MERLCRVQLVQRTKKGMLYRVQLIKKEKETEYSWFRGSMRRIHCKECSWFRRLKRRRCSECSWLKRRSRHCTDYSWFRGSRRRKHCTEFSWFRGLKTMRLFTDCNRTVRRSGFGALVGFVTFVRNCI